ncbi:hypothetical protein ACS0TY_030867 [Phlomoides rotata]
MVGRGDTQVAHPGGRGADFLVVHFKGRVSSVQVDEGRKRKEEDRRGIPLRTHNSIQNLNLAHHPLRPVSSKFLDSEQKVGNDSEVILYG